MTLKKDDGLSLGEVHKLNLHIESLTFSEALVYVMDYYRITIDKLADNSLLDYKTIVRYRGAYNKPTKVTTVQLCYGLGCNFFTSRILLFKAGFVLGDTLEDIIYSDLLQRANNIDIYNANQIINTLNKTLFQAEKIKKFRE